MSFPVLARGVHATAALHFGALSRSWIPLLVIHLPAALDDDRPVNDFALWRLRGQGWGNPAQLLRGGDLDCLARASIDGALGDGALTVAYGGQVLFQGPVQRPAGWVGAVRTTGAVPVLLTTVAGAGDLTALARDGLLVGAWARLFHRGTGVADPAPPDLPTGDRGRFF